MWSSWICLEQLWDKVLFGSSMNCFSNFYLLLVDRFHWFFYMLHLQYIWLNNISYFCFAYSINMPVNGICWQWKMKVDWCPVILVDGRSFQKMVFDRYILLQLFGFFDTVYCHITVNYDTSSWCSLGLILMFLHLQCHPQGYMLMIQHRNKSRGCYLWLYMILGLYNV
jgi:hypothetical protein